MTSPYPPPPSWGPTPGWGPTYPAQQPPPSKAMAGWALALGILGCCGISAVVAIVLSIVVLVRSKDGRDHGKGLAVAGLVIGGLWLLASIALVVLALVGAFGDLGDAHRNADGQVTSTQSIPVDKLRLGDCYDDAALAGAGGTSVVTDFVTVKPCSLAHQFEVYRVFTLTGDAYPGDDQVKTVADEDCVRSFAAFVGRPAAQSDYEPYALHPTQRSWTLTGDRTVQCSVGEPGTSSTGTARQAGH